MKRVNISITEKYKALQKIEEGKSMKKSIAEEYGVKKNTISTWIANKRKIIEAYESGQVNSSRKKLKKSDNKDLDEAVFTWFKNVRSNNSPVNGIIIKEKALSLAKSLELTDFRASDGWLDKWKQRYNVTFKAVSGEGNAVTPEMTASWSETYLPIILSKYELKDIYNADEFGLFYQALADKSFHYTGERCNCGKHSKVRLTRLAAGNATGEKLPLFVIGKYAKPRCFSGVKSLPCCYRSQKKSWMDWDLFTEWVKELDRKYAAQDRKIALTVDNCPDHPKVDGLKAIELIFLPPNTTSKTQPMDQGVIRSLKAFYHHSIIKRYITSIDGGRSPTNVNMLEAMTLLTVAWECVSPITLVNCFRKAGMSSESQALSQSDDDDPFKLLAAQLEEFQDKCESPSDFKVDGYVDADENVVTSEAHLLTESEIIARVTQTQLDAAEHDDENEEDNVDREMLPPRRDQVRQAIEILQSCCLYQDDGEQKMWKKVAEIEKLYEISLLKQKQQSLITDFFKL